MVDFKVLWRCYKYTIKETGGVAVIGIRMLTQMEWGVLNRMGHLVKKTHSKRGGEGCLLELRRMLNWIIMVYEDADFNMEEKQNIYIVLYCRLHTAMY